MALSERTKVTIPLGVAAAFLLCWLLFLTQLTFQIKEDVAVIKATVVPPTTKVAGNP